MNTVNIYDEVIIVENKSGQGYIVDPNNKKQLDSALYWADSSEYYNQRVTPNYDPYTNKLVNRYTNGKFRLQIKASAGGSSQGGKLSFWNCSITAEDGKTYLIGINSELLCNFIKNNTLVNGECMEDVYLGRTNSNVGAYTKNMSEIQRAKECDDLKKSFKKNSTDKYKVGDIVETLTIKEVYLGTIYKTFGVVSSWSAYDKTQLKVYKNAREQHLFIDYSDEGIIPEGRYYYTELRNSKPRRKITGHIEFDLDKMFQQLDEQYNKHHCSGNFPNSNQYKIKLMQYSRVNETLSDKDAEKLKELYNSMRRRCDTTVEFVD
ncbi:MAG: hypothetical protein RR342_01365 [Bacilli bacterium]